MDLAGGYKATKTSPPILVVVFSSLQKYPQPNTSVIGDVPKKGIVVGWLVGVGGYCNWIFFNYILWLVLKARNDTRWTRKFWTWRIFLYDAMVMLVRAMVASIGYRKMIGRWESGCGRREASIWSLMVAISMTVKNRFVGTIEYEVGKVEMQWILLCCWWLPSMET